MPLLNQFIALALAAGREILAVRDQGFDTDHKRDGSPVTLADQRAEAVIEAGLHRLAPEIPMLGEEAVEAGRIPNLGARFFCVDPLDGTKGFARGGDQFTVNIALIEDGAPRVGVVFAPASGDMYAGEPGQALAGRYDGRTGAVLNPLCPIRTVRAAPERWRIVASEDSGRNEATSSFIAALDGAPAHASSSIKFCRIAEGSAELYPRFGDVCEWDVAAGHAVLAAAGGDIMDLAGKPLRYGGAHGRFLVPGFVAYANEAAKAAALAALKR
ncbi:MAG: 3'(2'),5'-bisphosphate nucleotidase CysQ [Hyphomonadaceae bacterium]|nr:3'(2'),5'-bisphosphate nucleotidase CysQ [Hyphomonadaceae bacterium]